MKRFFSALLCLCYFALINGQNPVLPPYAFIPDGEPHVFKVNGEERLFIYGSRDETTNSYCGTGHDLWSAPVGDLTKWTFHGEIFNFSQIENLGTQKNPLRQFFAPDCVYNPVTKKYYLYTFVGGWDWRSKLDSAKIKPANKAEFESAYDLLGPNCVMAQSDTPWGPFTNPVMCDWPGGNKNRTFDPSVIVVDQPDGSVRVWAYWGANKHDRWAEIDPNDMHTIIDAQTRKPDRTAIFKTLNNPALNNYANLFEASSIKQVDKDKFVFIFSPQPKISGLTYCYSNSPEGPWKYGGVIINNNVNWRGANNHGSIVKVKNQWYVVYHRQAPNSYNRQAMIEPIDLKIEGDKVIIPEVEMTSQGILKNGLPYKKIYYAGIVCHIEGKAIVDGRRRIKDGYNPVVVEPEGATLGYKYFNFGTAKLNDLTLIMNAKSTEKWNIKIEILPRNQKQRILLKEQECTPTSKGKEAFENYTIPIAKLIQNADLVKAGGLTGSAALFITIKPTASTVELKEIGFK